MADDYSNIRVMEEKFDLNLPPYLGFDQIVELPLSEPPKL